ncbi:MULTISPECIES: GNAT family N-acetyltransferase [Sphingobacterium]|jgi:RimJ/RimL family protein N-acetyltransferase|uniref:GNAT family N-acetyltransferase n=1 Tax=Sphingobacterium TaxID=28453 RepID=UPI00257B9F6D|nr:MULTISPECIES: GNAT family N-acetyltransferase [Sphingobacterium]
MTDPTSAMQSFQDEFSKGNIQLQPCINSSGVYVYADQINKKARLTYITLQDTTITSFVNFVSCAPIDGIPGFQIGYAVPELYRNNGSAKKTISNAITEMRYGFRSAGIIAFYIEALVDADNKASQRVAEQVISANPENIIDEFSGLPALRYFREIK